MADTSNFARCEQARQNLRDLREERDKQRQRITWLEERLALRRGEIAEAENTLARFEEAAQQTGDGAIAMGIDILAGDMVGLAKDSVLTAIKLSNITAEQRQQVAHLKREQDKDIFDLRTARENLNIIELNIERARNFIQSNGCR